MSVQVMGAENSKWSESFSLDTVGSEGVFSCETNDGQVLQVTMDTALITMLSVILSLSDGYKGSPL